MSKGAALEAALNAVWAMEESALERLLAVAARENEVTPEALEAYRAKSLEKADRATVRDGVAVVGVTGPLFRRANLFTALSGASSYDTIRLDLQAAVDDPKVRAIVLNIDSPGGEVNGASELAQAVFDVRGKKPIVSYVGGLCASAAYWIGSSGDLVVASDTALLGSIGAQYAILSQGERPGTKSFRFVSSQSPLKNAAPDTEAGAKGIQAMVDALAQVFVEAVARNRGVATETVLSDFGKGGVFVGQAAVEAGLADSVGSFESVLAALAAGEEVAAPRGQRRSKRASMENATGDTAANSKSETATATATVTTAAPAASAPVDVNAAVAAAMTAERSRIGGLTQLADAHGVASADLNAAIESGSTVEAFALKVASDAKARQGDQLDALKRDETEAPKPDASVRASETKSADALAAEIIAAANLASGKA